MSIFTIVSLLLLARKFLGSKQIFRERPLEIFLNSLDFEPIYSNMDFLGVKKASIEYDIDFVGPKGDVAFLVIGSRTDLDIGVVCSRKDLLKVDPEKSKGMLIKKVELDRDPVNIKGVYDIQKTGLYSYFTLSCEDPLLSIMLPEDSVIPSYVSGTVTFTNPYGLLPAHRHPFFKFYCFTALLYVAFFIYWNVYCSYFKENLSNEHTCIKIISILAILEMTMHYFDVYTFNKVGIRKHSIFLLANIVHIFRNVLARTAIALICNGVGIEKKKADDKLIKVLMGYNLAYFFLRVAIEMRHSFKVSLDFNFLNCTLEFSMLIINVLFYTGVAYCLVKTIGRLGPNDEHKKKLLKKFGIMIVVGGNLFVIVSLMQINYYQEKRWQDVAGWKLFWMYEVGLAECLFFYYLVTSSYFLSPSTKIAGYSQIGDVENPENSEDTNTTDLNSLEDDYSSSKDEEETKKKKKEENKDEKKEDGAQKSEEEEKGEKEEKSKSEEEKDKENGEKSGAESEKKDQDKNRDEEREKTSKVGGGDENKTDKDKADKDKEEKVKENGAKSSEGKDSRNEVAETNGKDKVDSETDGGEEKETPNGEKKKEDDTKTEGKE